MTYTARGITVYGCGPDEAAAFRESAPRFGLTPTLTQEPPTESTAAMAAGNRCISVGHKTRITRSALRALGRAGLPVPPERLERDFREPYEPHPGVTAVFRTIYEDPQKHWSAYEMAEKLVDVEQRFQLWRYRHMLTVQRIIGFRRGTGGSSGVAFLKKALDLRFFPELWDVRTELSPHPRGS